MATMPDKSKPEPLIVRAAAKFDARAQSVILLAVASALVTFAPEPMGAIGSAALTLVAAVGTRR